MALFTLNAGYQEKDGDPIRVETGDQIRARESRSRFLQAATRPFDYQAETRMAAQCWLDGLVQADDARLDEAVKRWEEADRKPARSKGKWAFFVLVALASLLVGILCTEDTWNHFRSARILITEEFGESAGARERVFPKLTASQKLLFPESCPGHSSADVKERMWRDSPENPAYFAEYVRSYTRERTHPPEAFLETARKLDADNSWFTYFAAYLAAEGTFEQNADQSWQILDQSRFDQAVILLREARGQTVCESYGAEMMALRTEALPSGNFPESLDGIMMLASAYTGTFQMMMNVPSLFSAQSWMAAESRDVEAFREVSEGAAKFLSDISSSRVETMLNEVITSGVALSMSSRLSTDAERLGLSAETEHWKGVLGRLQENKKARSSGKFMLDGREANPQESESILLSNSFEVAQRVVKHPPSLGKVDLKPGWMVDHFFAARISCYVLWLTLAFCLGGVALYRLRVAAVPRGISCRAVDLLNRKDWAWILGGGVLFPFVYVTAIVFATPLGGHDSGMKGTGMLVPFGQFLGLCLLWTTAPAQIAGWRFGKRAAVLGFFRPGWLGWVTVITAAAFVPMVGYAAISHSFAGFWRDLLFENLLEIVRSSVSPASFWIAFGFAAGVFLIVLGRTTLAIFSRQDLIIPRASVSMALAPAFALALLLITFAIPVFQYGGQYWFVRDKLQKRAPELPGWTGYEAKITHQARKELREAVGF